MRTISNIFILCTAIFPLLIPSLHAQDIGNRDRAVKVMTRNLDAGSDFGYVIQAASDPQTTQFQLVIAVTQTFQEMIASNIPERAGGIADEIADRQPDLIGLQEVTTLRTGPFGHPADAVVVD